jgi:predicted nucleic acid-binding protein
MLWLWKGDLRGMRRESGLILVDSSVWIDFFSSSRAATGAELHRLIEEAEPLALTVVIVTEGLQGRTRDASAIERYLRMWEMLEPSGFQTYRAAAAIFRAARTRGSV